MSLPALHASAQVQSVLSADMPPVKGLLAIESLIRKGSSVHQAAIVEYTPEDCDYLWNTYGNEFNRDLNRIRAQVCTGYINDKAWLPLTDTVVFGQNKEGRLCIIDGHHRIYGGARATAHWRCLTSFTDYGPIETALGIGNGKERTIGDMARLNGYDFPNAQKLQTLCRSYKKFVEDEQLPTDKSARMHAMHTFYTEKRNAVDLILTVCSNTLVEKSFEFSGQMENCDGRKTQNAGLQAALLFAWELNSERTLEFIRSLVVSNHRKPASGAALLRGYLEKQETHKGLRPFEGFTLTLKALLLQYNTDNNIKSLRKSKIPEAMDKLKQDVIASFTSG